MYVYFIPIYFSKMKNRLTKRFLNVLQCEKKEGEGRKGGFNKENPQKGGWSRRNNSSALDRCNFQRGIFQRLFPHSLPPSLLPPYSPRLLADVWTGRQTFLAKTPRLPRHLGGGGRFSRPSRRLSRPSLSKLLVEKTPPKMAGQTSRAKGRTKMFVIPSRQCPNVLGLKLFWNFLKRRRRRRRRTKRRDRGVENETSSRGGGGGGGEQNEGREASKMRKERYQQKTSSSILRTNRNNSPSHGGKKIA